MAVDFMDPQSLRDRFAELTTQADALTAAGAPLRDQRDTLVRETETQVEALDTQIAEAESGLFDIQQERAVITRALGGRVGNPEPVEQTSE